MVGILLMLGVGGGTLVGRRKTRKVSTTNRCDLDETLIFGKNSSRISAVAVGAKKL